MKKHVGIFFLSLALLLPACNWGDEAYEQRLPRSRPEEQGVMIDGILGFLYAVRAEGIDMHSFMLLRHGNVVAETYWYPYKASYRHIMHSVSKTFTSTAIGFAVQEKRLKVSDKVISFFPGELPAKVSPYLKELSVKDLLTMSVGQEPAPTFFMSDSDWVRSFLATPIVHEPGTKFQYSSYASYLLSAIIQKVTGQTTFDYLKPRLFRPLGITGAKWEEGAQGITAGGWGLRIHTEDMAKLGLFYLRQGNWQGKQLLNAAWIKEASSVQIFQNDSLNYKEEMNDEGAQGYGYQIWRCTNGAYRADGADGQFIIVMPKEDAVVVITENTRKTQDVLHLVFQYLQPAMNDLLHVTSRDMQEQLATALNTAAIPVPFLTPDSLRFPTDTACSFRFADNPLHFEEAAFRFDSAGVCALQLRIGADTCRFAFGQDGWQFGQTRRLSPYFLSPRRNPKGLAPFPVAGYGSWTDASTLKLRLLYLEDYQTETYVCRFKDGDLEMQVSNDVQTKAVALKGTRMNPT
ncbi:MAG: beta-lactamase family protein [Tannerella sp.]|jgi:CubicO group peptidase (beta-lactamase class C family)|nr:beta-lactamase family protein [Tannerella sp.]